MLQIHYDALYEWTQSGMPIARALFLNDPDYPQLYQHLADEFFVGRDVLVRRSCSRARGRHRWRHAASTRRPAATGTPSRTTPRRRTRPWPVARHDPELLRRTSTLCRSTSAPAQSCRCAPRWSRVRELAQNPLDIAVYPGPDRNYLLYQDDGVTTQAQNACAFRTTLISQQTTQAARIVTLARQTDNYTPAEPYALVRLLNMAALSARAGLRHSCRAAGGIGQQYVLVSDGEEAPEQAPAKGAAQGRPRPRPAADRSMSRDQPRDTPKRSRKDPSRAGGEKVAGPDARRHWPSQGLQRSCRLPVAQSCKTKPEAR